MVNRALGTGTRLLFDHELKKAGIVTGTLSGYEYEVAKHMDVGLEVLSGRADARLKPWPAAWGGYDTDINKERSLCETP